jgi:hypothetical protein
VQTTEHAENPKGLPPKERTPGTLPSIATKKVILGQGPWCDEELTTAWERYMQTDGLSQHVCCQHCDNTEKQIAVVSPGRMEQRRQLVCFCTNCWSFTSRHHSKDVPMDISLFKQFNPNTGKFHWVLPYVEEEHPRRIRGQVTDHELDQFRKEHLKPRKAGKTGAPMRYFAHTCKTLSAHSRTTASSSVVSERNISLVLLSYRMHRVPRWY